MKMWTNLNYIIKLHSSVEINNHFFGAGIDGVIRDFPQTGATYRSNPIETGGLLQFVAQQLLPPAETPNPIILSENDVVEPPLPPIAKITPAGNESTTDRSILRSSMREINNLKTRLSATFEMKDLSPAKQILGMKISRDRSAGTLNLSQELYIENVLSRFRVNDAKPRTTPLENHFKLSNEQSPKTVEERKVTLHDFVDADLGGDVDSNNSTSGYIYTIGGTAVSWMFRLQKCVSLSSTEAEYVAIAEAGKEMI
uniref:glycerophosphodiester phosphodiesterase n=1 Tax=Solanum lycopersicum TaxID=4081 RepID=A0A3Q7JTK4_SOLLC